MKVAVVSLFPEMFSALTEYGISGRAFEQGLIELRLFNPRDFTEDRHATVDDRPYGGGPGMVMLIEPLRRAIAEAKTWVGEEAKVVYLSPQGSPLTQTKVKQLVDTKLILVAGRYEGIDERLLDTEIDEEISIGDYVVSGGELPAMVLLDALVRLIPGALGHEQSAEQDSFMAGLLDCPHYTRPEEYQGRKVPEVLLSGNHEKIRRWRLQQALVRTQERRPDLLGNRQLTAEERELLANANKSANTDDSKN